MASIDAVRLLERMCQPGGREAGAKVYAILDAARNRKVYASLPDREGNFYSLYRGEPAETLAHVAPYLIRLDDDISFTQKVVDWGWGDSWGILFSTAASLRQMRDHFRQFLVVYDETARSLVFRYYDPRVFRIFLPTCDAEQLSMLFGPVDRFFVEGDQRDAVIEYALVGDKLVHEEIKLATV